MESLQREEAEELVKKYGGKATKSVSKNTSYILSGDDAGPAKLSKVSTRIYSWGSAVRLGPLVLFPLSHLKLCWGCQIVRFSEVNNEHFLANGARYDARTLFGEKRESCNVIDVSRSHDRFQD